MTIHFGYEKGQVMQALRYHFISPPIMRIMIVVVNVFAMFCLTLYFLGKIGPMLCFLASFLWISFMISAWFVLPGVVYRRTITYKHNFSMDFREDGFTLSHENGSKTWPWTVLIKYMETPHFFHLYFAPNSFILVPKNGCRDKDEIFELRQLLKTKVKKK